MERGYPALAACGATAFTEDPLSEPGSLSDSGFPLTGKVVSSTLSGYNATRLKEGARTTLATLQLTGIALSARDDGPVKP